MSMFPPRPLLSEEGAKIVRTNLIRIVHKISIGNLDKMYYRVLQLNYEKRYESEMI